MPDPRRARRSSATPEPRRTRPRSSSCGSTASRTGSRRSSRSTAPSTDGRWPRSRRPDSRAKRAPFEPLVDWFRFVPPDDLAALDAAVTDDDRCRVARARARRGRRASARRFATCAACAGSATSAGRCSWPTRCSRVSAGAASGCSPAARRGRGRRAHAREGARRRAARSGRCVARAELSFEPGDHASTFGGGPVPCAARARGARHDRTGRPARAGACDRRRGCPRRSPRLAPEGSSSTLAVAGCLWAISARASGRERRRARDDRRRRACESTPGPTSCGSRRRSRRATTTSSRPRPRSGPRSRRSLEAAEEEVSS